MNKRYQIWDKESSVITPIGEVLTAEQWLERYPMAALPNIKLIIGGGTINGSVCLEFSSTVDMYERMGCDFSACETDQDYLDAIAAFEDARNEPVEIITPEERIAAALEAQVMMSLPDDEEVME